MSPRRAAPWIALTLLSPACDRTSRQATGPPAAASAPGRRARPGVTAAGPLVEADVRAGQSLYVPVYPSVPTRDGGDPYPLAVTLSVRNTDAASAVVVTAARYHDSNGRPVRDFISSPMRVGPLAALEFFVRESDTAAGVAAGVVVEWVADRPVTPPVVEAVMVGTAGAQGVSFTSQARVLSDRGGRTP